MGTVPRLSERIFPGIHNDIGGRADPFNNNDDLLNLALSWMLARASNAGVEYLGDVKKLLEEEIKLITANPVRLKPGPMQFPDGVLDKDPSVASDPSKAIDDEIDGKIYALSYPPGGYDSLLERYHTKLPELFLKRPYELLTNPNFPRNFPPHIHWQVSKNNLIQP